MDGTAQEAGGTHEGHPYYYYVRGEYSLSSAGPYVPDMLMHPSPMAETSNSVLPNFRYCMPAPRCRPTTALAKD